MKTIVILTHVVFDNSLYCSFVHEHAKALKEQGYNVIVLAVLNWFPFISFFRKKRKEQYKEKRGTKTVDGIKIIYKKRLSFSNILKNSKININGFTYYLSVKRIIKNIFKENDVAFIDAHFFKVEGYAAAKFHKKYGCFTFLTCHGTNLIKTTESKNAEFIVTNICSNLDKIICVSNYLENKLKEFNINNTHVIYNGINFYYKHDEIKLDEKENVILTVAGLVKRKKIDLVIKAFNEINDKRYNLNIIGNGPECENLGKIVDELGISNRVVFLGHLDNHKVYEEMKKSKIFILPSVDEGFGIVYPEAMYNGCITVGTKNEGIDGFIINGENGFLVEPEIKNIVDTLNYIIDNEKDLMDNIVKKSMESAKQLCWKNNAIQYIEIFNKEGNK